METRSQQSADTSKDSPPRRKYTTRAARACDECRSRKTKCDGLYPCKTCQTSDRLCTYNQTYGRNESQGQRVRVLQERLRRARAYLEELQRRVPDAGHVNFDALLGSPEEQRSSQDTGGSPEKGDDKSSLDSMMDYYGRMTMRDRNEDYYGAASGLAFLQKTKEYFEQPSGEGMDFQISDTTHTAISQLFDAPLPEKQALDVDVPMSHLLPHRQTASKLLEAVFNDAYPLYTFIDVDQFHERTDRLYRLEPIEYDDYDHHFLPLFYIVTGFGFLFRSAEHRKYGCRGAVSHAMRHFIAVRNMVDVTQCRSIMSLQILACFVLFLISAARVSLAHTYLGIAAASTFRLGLHSHFNHDPEATGDKTRVRLRLFWTIVRLDQYASTVLGLPTFIDSRDIDPAVESQMEDALTEARESFAPSRHDALRMALAHKHLQVLRITRKAVEILFPRPPKAPASGAKSTITVSVTKLQGIERDFKDWEKDVSRFLSQHAQDEGLESSKFELEMAYYQGHIILYRPFLHYLAKMRDEETTDKRQLKCILACIKVASSVISRSEQMLQKENLYPAAWPAVYTIFLSVVCLIFFIATQRGTQAANQTQQKVETGIRLLASTSCHDTGADRCLEILQMLIDRLSHVITVDIDQIRNGTKSMCQSDTPKGKGKETSQETSEAQRNLPSREREFNERTPDPLPTSSAPFDVSWPESVSSTERADVPWQSSGSSSDRADVPWHLPSSQTQPHWFPQAGNPYSADLPMDQYFSELYTEPGVVHPLTSEAEQLLPSYSLSDVPSTETMEIPYAQEFAWPYDDSSAGPSGTQHGAGVVDDLSKRRISPEDIAAFMRIMMDQFHLGSPYAMQQSVKH